MCRDLQHRVDMPGLKHPMRSAADDGDGQEGGLVQGRYVEVDVSRTISLCNGEPRVDWVEHAGRKR